MKVLYTGVIFELTGIGNSSLINDGTGLTLAPAILHSRIDIAVRMCVYNAPVYLLVVRVCVHHVACIRVVFHTCRGRNRSLDKGLYSLCVRS